MRSNAVNKTTIGSRGTSKTSNMKKNKDLDKPLVSLKRRMRNSVISPKLQNDTKAKKKSSPQTKSPVSVHKNGHLNDEGVSATKASNLRQKEAKKIQKLKKVKGTLKEKGKAACKTPKVLVKANVKKKKQLMAKGKSKKKESSLKEFIDIWSLASIGKREASLNATMKVNIMYERQISPKKSSPVKSSPTPKKSINEPKMCMKESTASSSTTNSSSPAKKDGPKAGKESTKKMKPAISPKKSAEKKGNVGRKRKAQYKIYEDEPAAKSRKTDNDKTPKTKSKKVSKRQKKTSVLGHSLGNIIERSPRQASLNAKAMIAMEQEDDTPVETAARTKVYDWTEVRSCVVNDARKMIWVTGNGDLKSLAQSKKASDSDTNHTSVTEGDNVSTDIVQNQSFSLHDSLLKTIHEKGDERLLKEFFRSQKEDFPGEVDIERCPTPEPPPTPVKETTVTTSSPKKKSPSHSSEVKKTPEKQVKKPIVPSPTKPKPCRVATPIPQFSPGQQRPSHMTSFIHHPAAQSIYSNLGDQHQKQLPTPPIKVTPYAPSSAYVYQCSPERQQQNVFVPNTPSSMPFNSDTNDLVQRNYPATFTFNQIGGLSFERRGLNPYQHPQNSAYNPSMHLPIQPIGFNFQQFYQPSIQQLHSQQNLPSLQPVPLAHQQYALVPPPSVMQQPHSLTPHLGPIRPYQQSPFQQYPAPSTEVKQGKACMAPPPCPVTQSLPQPSPMTSIIQSLPSYRRAIPVTPQMQSHKLLKPSPERFSVANSSSTLTTTSSSVAIHPFNPQIQPHPMFSKGNSSKVIHNPLPIRPVSTGTAAFRPIVCKKEAKLIQQNCDKVSTPVSVGSPKKSVKNSSEESSMSDILHSAHSTMFSVEEKGSGESTSSYDKQTATVSSSNSSPPKESRVINVLASSKSSENFNGSYSVTSILEMPNCKVKTEPKTKSCAINTDKNCHVDQMNKVTKKETYYLCIPPPKVNGKPGTSLLTTTAIPLKENFPYKLPEDLSIKQFPNSNKVIVINDSEDSSDDEPLAKLVQSKPNEDSKPKLAEHEAKQPKTVKNTSKALKVKLFEKKSNMKATKPKEIKSKLTAKECKDSKKAGKVIPQVKAKLSKDQPRKSKKDNDICASKASTGVIAKEPIKKDNGIIEVVKAPSENCVMATDSNDGATAAAKKPDPKMMKKVPVRRKSKTQVSVPPMVPKTKAVHGWSWVGEGDWKMIPKLTQQREESLRLRKCYKSMKHTYGEVISVKDCVILQSDGDGSVPYVGKVSALWENFNGDMMFSMLWYYQPEHTAVGREPEDGEQELFASKHREENSVACIDDKCYVLMYNEFCRLEADSMRQELGVPTPSSQVIPPLSKEDRSFLRPLPPPDVCMDNIWFCRYDYDTRKKIVRKPKHKKTDLRYRGPCKLVQ